MSLLRPFRLAVLLIVVSCITLLSFQTAPAQTEPSSPDDSLFRAEEPPIPLPQGSAQVTLSPADSRTPLGSLPLQVAFTEQDAAEELSIDVATLDAAKAFDLSPVGFAFELNATPAGRSKSSALDTPPLELTLDYSQIPLRYGASIADRLTLYRVSGCQMETVDTSTPGKEALESQTKEVLNCTKWETLAVRNDRANEQLVVDLGQDVEESLLQAEAREGEEPPLEAAPVEKEPRILPGGPSYYVLSTLTGGQQGDYSYTPFSAVTDFQVSLSSGAMTTGYPIPVPPAKAGAVPGVGLSYNSGLIDGMHTSKNAQPGSVGLGWTLQSGAIIRHLETCNNYYYAPGDLCLTGDNYTIILNGVQSRLVKESGSIYHLQNDPYWKVEQKTSSETNHPDIHKTYWLVTTPDGTQYRFGGEIVPETDADQDSVFYTTIYDTTTDGCYGETYNLCDMAWQWNLDRVEDTNGNVINYFYELEKNYYKARNASTTPFRRQYVRAGHVSRIEYTTTAGGADSPHARVLFNTELRCTNPTTADGCDWPADFPDTPGDLECQYTGTCSEYKPSFWSQRRLGSIQTQVYDETDNRWEMVTHYNLDQGFPTPPDDGQGDESESKLWLGEISQHPGGEFSRWAFIQHEAEDYDSESGTDTQVTSDVGQGVNVGWIDDGDYLVFEDVNFDGGATTLAARVASVYSGASIEFRLDSTSGTNVATINVPNTGDWQTWETVETTVSGASGVHDLYLVFKNTGLNINWFRFGPHFGSGSSLPGLPAVSYDYEMLTNRRNYDVGGVSPMYMPRIDQVTTELGGTVDFTYGQSHACPVSSGSGYIRFPYDCFVAWDIGDPNYTSDDGWVLWHKWKVMEQENSDTFSGNETQTLSYDYSTPTWHYGDEPSLPDINYCSYCPTRHWNDFRGSEIVTVTDDSDAQTEYRFHRGMNGDRLGVSGGSYSASITLSDSSTRQDDNWLRGQVAEVRRLDAQDNALTKSVNWFTSANTAGSGTSGAYFVGTQKTEATIYGTTNETTRTEYEYDDYGNLSREILHGDISTTDDDRNVETGYLHNTADHIVDRPYWTALWDGTESGGAVGGEEVYTCTTYDSTDVPVYISPTGTPTITSDLTIGDSGTIEDINVLDLNGTHTWFGNLDFKLTSPEDTDVQIMVPSCGSGDNFDLNLDDEATPGWWPCPPTDGGTYQPSYALSNFDGEEMSGTWTLTVDDNYNYSGGYLNGWSLEICRDVKNPPAAIGTEKALTFFTYDGGGIGVVPTKGNLTMERSYSKMSPAQYYDTTITYDSQGRPATVTDPNSRTTSTGYHSFYGYTETITNTLSHVTSTVVDPKWGVATEVTDANNKVTTVDYDEYGRLTDVWLPTELTTGPASLEYDYHPEARPAYVKIRNLQDSSTSAYLDLWSYVDGFGREIQSQRPSVTANMRVVSSQQMNDLGQLVHQSAPYEISGTAGSGYSQPTWSGIASYQRFTYDDLGRSTLQEMVSGSSALWSTSTSYDGWTTQYTDANGRDTDNETDGFGQLVEVTEYNDEGSGQVTYTTEYEYDLQDNLTQVTDHFNNVTTMSYDLLGRKTSMTDPDMGAWTYQYDAVGNLTAQQDGRGQWIYMAYDGLNRVTGKRRDSANGSLISEYSYDTGDKGHLDSSKAYDAFGLTVNVQVQYLNRDDRYRVTQQQWVVNGQGSFKMGYGYDEADNLVSVQYPADNLGALGETVTRNYNSVGQLNQVISQQDNTRFLDGATYKPGGQIASLRLDQSTNGATITYSYQSGSMRLLQKQAGSGSGGTINLQNLSYGYDNGGNVTGITDAINSGQALSFGYDWLSRLTSAGTTAVGTGQYSHTYAYDAIGNITNNNGSSYTYSATQPHAVTAAFGNSYGYDANGNQAGRTISGTAYTQVFDYENRLVEVKQGSTTIGAFVYDADGNRVVGTVSGTTTVYIAGLFEYQGGAMTSYYAGVNGPVALRRTGYSSNNGIFYMLDDHLKSTGVILNQNGTISAQQYYYPFGGNRGGAFSPITSKRFTGQYHEGGLPGGEGLSYYNARWYDSQLGRFLSADTIVPNPANPQSLNRMAYVHNNPMRYTDPSGHVLDAGGDSSGPPPSPPPTPGSTASGWSGPGFYYVYYYHFNPYKRGYNPYASTHRARAGIPQKWKNGLDISSWLVSQMHRNAQSRQFKELSMHHTAGFLMGDAPLATRWHVSYPLWKSLVGEDKPWDFKTIFEGMKISFVSINGENYRMDILGNIHYGFIGNLAGFSRAELHIGAGHAQQTGEHPELGSLWSLGDTPEDFKAVTFGIALARTYGSDFTMRQYEHLFQLYAAAGVFNGYKVTP